METSFDLMLWREALADAAPVPGGAELEEWAQRLDEAGQNAAAALLSDVAALHRGLLPHGIPAPGFSPFGDEASVGGRWTLHRALAELRDLAQFAGVASLPRLAELPAPAPSGRPDNPAGIGAGVPAPAVAGDMAVTARRLRELLEQPSAREDELLVLLTGLVEADRRCPDFDFRTFRHAPLALLVPAIALAGLIDFALSTRDLWSAPLGSPALLHRAARLDVAGLGPFLGNVGRLVRDSRDLAMLARMACEAAIGAGDADAEREAWLVLLSRGCRGGLLYEVLDDLGDHAMQGALAGILDRVSSRSAAAIDTAMIMRLRDAGLDNADYAMAARAQRVLVRLDPDSKLEAVILGSIEASGGEFGRAEAIFREWQAREPDDLDVRDRLLAIRRDRFDQFTLPYGFGSPADRRETRLRRRGVPPDYPRRQGERIRAVDVG